MNQTAAHPDTSILRLGRWLSHYALKRPGALIAVVVTMLLKTAIEVLKPWPMFIVVDHVLRGKVMPANVQRLVALLPGVSDPQTLLAWAIAGTIVLFLLSWAVGVAATYANLLFGQRMVYDLAGDLFSHLQRLSLGFHSRRSVGDSIRRVTTDSGCVAALVKDALIPIISSVFSLCAMFVIMWRIDAALTMVSLLVVPPLLFVVKRFAQPMLDRSYRQQEVESEIYKVVEQTLSAIPIVQAFGRERDADARLRGATTASVSAALATTTVQLQFKVLIGLITALGTAGIVWFGGWRALGGAISVGGILVFLSYLASLYSPIEALIYAPSSVQHAAGSARRVLELLETEHDVRESPSATAMPRVRGDVDFQDVTFGYDRDRPILRGLNLHIPAGTMVAIVGSTGAGKSTIASLVPRLFDPWSGRVLFDGRDVRDATLASLRSQVSLVLQESFLFPISIAHNIAYGRPHASQAEIEAAARAAEAHEFIMRLPDGYQTIVGERGATLSGGERQRISIARAILRDAPILVLDEPTSALDAATEALLMSALRSLTRGRTTLMIAHRLSTVRAADEIVVLDRGMIVERGTHDQLLQQAGLYARLYEALHRDGRGSGSASAGVST